jgi:chromosome segregation ATPase
MRDAAMTLPAPVDHEAATKVAEYSDGEEYNLGTELSSADILNLARAYLARDTEVEALTADFKLMRGNCLRMEDRAEAAEAKIKEWSDVAMGNAQEIVTLEAEVAALRSPLERIAGPYWSQTDDVGQLQQIIAEMQRLASAALEPRK